MADGKVVIETDLDNSGIEKGIKESKSSIEKGTKSMKVSFEELARQSGKSVEELKNKARELAAEYQKQGVNIPNSYKKAYDEMGVYSDRTSKKIQKSSEQAAKAAEKASNDSEEGWKESFGKIEKESGRTGERIKSDAKEESEAHEDASEESAKSWEKSFLKIESIAKKGFDVVKKAVVVAGTAIVAAGTAATVVGSNFEEGMSKVSAISGAAGKDLESLTSKAKEMGAKTKFSATEAASAFEFMAMAGWKTADMLGGIDGIMNLAAASGEDLALVSDIVTDAITAFGLSASDSGHFADVLAAASSNANTNVSMLGESFKYVAPIAGAMKYSVEDTSLALGLMANASVKGSMAGTSLKTSLANLASPTDSMAGVMEKYGISLTNADGSMKSLKEMIELLREKMGGLDEATQTAAASTLFGKEAMAGMLAIINASEADYQKLAKAVNHADGTAQSMSDTMQNNLKGSITILKSGLEGLGIQIYDSMEEPLKSAAQKGIDSVSRLSTAFSRGGFSKAVEEAGKIVEEFTDNLADSNETADAVIRPLKNFTKEALSLGKTALPPVIKAMELTAKNLDTLVPLTVAGCAAYKTYGAVSKVVAATTKTVTAAKKANAAATRLLNRMDRENTLQLVATNGGLTVRQTLMAIHNGQLTVGAAATGLLAKAQMGLNAVMSANPIGLVVTAIGALAAGIGIYSVLTDDSAKATEGLSKEQKKVLESCTKMTDAMKEDQKAREESVKSIDREYDGYSSLAAELECITDENGKVKAGYEERAKVITGLLSDALGIEIEMTDGVIQKYGETVNAIQQVIVQKKAEALLSSMEAEMANAYEKTSEAMKKYKDVAAEVGAQKKKVEEATKAVADAQEMYDNVIKNGGDETGLYADQLFKAKKALKEAESGQKEATSEMEKAKIALSTLSTEVNNYDALVEAVASKDTAQIETAMNALIISYQSYTAEALSSSAETRQEMYDQANDYIESMKNQIPEAEKVSAELAESALHGMDVQKQLAKMRAAMDMEKAVIGANLTSRVVHEFMAEDFTSRLSELKVQLQDADIRKLARQFSAYAAADIIKGLEGMTMKANERELFRMVREAIKT